MKKRIFTLGQTKLHGCEHPEAIVTVIKEGQLTPRLFGFILKTAVLSIKLKVKLDYILSS